MVSAASAMHVARIRSRHVTKDGRRRSYESRYLRRTYRDGGKVKHETLASLSALPDATVDAIEAALQGQQLVPAGEAFTITRSLPHGQVAAVVAMARKLGLPGMLGPPCRERDLAFALICSRIVRPASKASTVRSWANTTIGTDLTDHDDGAGASTDEVFAAMDWLVERQDSIEAALARKHLSAAVNPSRMALFDLSSSWMEGIHCPLSERGYSRDGKKGKAQIEYGILTDPDGRPIAVRVFTGNTGDPDAFTEIVEVIRKKFGLADLVLVGDRGMITKARVDALAQLNDDPSTPERFGWITALRAPTIAKLLRDGPLQLSLFDQQNLAEITHPDYPGERLIACRNPLLADERARKRENLLQATEKLLHAVAERVRRTNLAGADDIGVEVGKVWNRYRVGKHFTRSITDTSFTFTRNQDKIDAEAALDGIYVLRTSVPAETLDSAGVVFGYKNLAGVERDFRIVKVDDLDLRPIRHRLEDRVQAHILICLLACYLVWHLRKAWAPLTFTDEAPPTRKDPVAPAQRSAHARAKASSGHDELGNPYYSFADLLDHLATLTRNQTRIHGTDTELPILAEATPDQRRAFELIDTSIPLTLK